MALSTTVTTAAISIGGRCYQINLRSTDFTVCFWANNGDTTSNRVMLAAIGNAGSDGWEINAHNQYFTYQYFNAGSASANPVGANVITQGVWYYICFQYQASPTTGAIFVDAVNQFTQSETVTMPSGNSVLTAIATAQDPLSGNTWLGQVAFVRIFDGLLTPAELLAERASPTPRNRRPAVLHDMPWTPAGASPYGSGSERSAFANYPTSVNGTLAFSPDPPLPPTRPATPTLLQRLTGPNIITYDATQTPVINGTGFSPLTLTSASINVPAKAMLVALVAAGWSGTGRATASVTDNSTGLVWVPAATAQGTTNNGGLATVWYAYVPTARTLTVTVTFAGFAAGTGGRYCDLLIMDNAAPDQAGSARATSTTISGTDGTLTLVTTAVGSLILGVSDDSTSNHTWTPNANTIQDNLF